MCRKSGYAKDSNYIMKFNLITVLGPTAVGKTRFAVQLAKKFNGEIISADSRQVYKQMDIGTGKDYDDYLISGNKIPYHLIDIIEPKDEYNLFQFKNDFSNAFNEISGRGKLPFLVGGTGLYIHSILKNYKLNKFHFNKMAISKYENYTIEELKIRLLKVKKKLHNTTDILIKERLVNALIIAESEIIESIDTSKIFSLTIGVKADRTIVKKRITARLKERFKNGMIEEVETLIKNGVTPERLKLFGLEYKFISMYLGGELNYNDMFQKLNSAIHKFAKRQMTWFRKIEREGVKIYWFENNEINSVATLIKTKFNF